MSLAQGGSLLYNRPPTAVLAAAYVLLQVNLVTHGTHADYSFARCAQGRRAY